MTDNVGAKKSFIGGFRDDFKALSTKQVIAVILAIAVSLIMEVLGLSGVCIGFLIIAVVLYMIPHLMKVMSVRVKAVMGIVFVILSLLIGTFGYGNVVDSTASYIDADTETVQNLSVEYDEASGAYQLHFEVNPTAAKFEGDWKARVIYGDITMVSFGLLANPTHYTTLEFTPDELTDLGNGWYSGTATLSNLTEGKFEYMSVAMTGQDNKVVGKAFTCDTGVDSGDIRSICFMGSGYTTFLVALMFFIILAFSALMRRSAMKTRAKMEAEGRLYPQGYGRCKECGAMVLPGEVVCRKCGAYIEVPEELKVHKKDFVICSECGAEVPADAKECPKCGAKFDEKEEIEVSHADGTVDVTTEMVPCPHCGEQVPANATWCPKCGKKIRE